MLRLIFASVLLFIGLLQAFRGPFYALLFYIFIAYFRPETWIWTGELRSLNISLIVGSLTVLMVIFSSDRFYFRRAMIPIVLFCVHGFVSTMLSPNWAWCLYWWQGFAKVTLINLLLTGLVHTRERMRLVLLVIVFSLGFEGVKQGWVYLVSLQDEINLNAIEILGDNNGVAVGMLMLAAIILALIQTTKKRWLQAVFAFMLVGVVYRSLTSYSRGGFLAFGAMCAMYFFRAKNRVVSLLLVGGLVALLPLLPQQYWDRMDTITADQEVADTSVLGRLHFWEVARRMADDHPILGVGTSGFQAAYNVYDFSEGAYGRGRAVHSMWFGILAEQGYVGLMLLVVIMTMAYRACGRVRSRAKAKKDEELIAYAGALQTSLVTVAVGGTFLSYHYVEILWHFIGLCFALQNIARLEAGDDAETSGATTFGVPGTVRLAS